MKSLIRKNIKYKMEEEKILNNKSKSRKIQNEEQILLLPTNLNINHSIIYIILPIAILLPLSILIYNVFIKQKYEYDYLIVGSGLYGATFNYLAKKQGKKTLVIERNNFTGGNLYCENIEGIYIHKYGPHIFHTNNKTIWDFVNSIVEFEPYITQPVAKIKKKMYSLPYNMWTFQELWNITNPQKAFEKIEKQRHKKIIYDLKDQAKSIVGKDIYNKFIKGDIMKKWQREVEDLPPFIIPDLPKRFVFDNNYFFNDKYQGIPKGCYNALINKLLNDTEVLTGVDYLKDRERFNNIAEKIIYTGKIDEFYNYTYTPLEYRSYSYVHKVKNTSNYQGAAIIETPHIKTKYLRSIEYKHFEPYNQKIQEMPKTVISYEYNDPWNEDKDSFYPLGDERNNNVYLKYNQLAEEEKKIVFRGRLGTYKYYDMQDIIKDVFEQFGM